MPYNLQTVGNGGLLDIGRKPYISKSSNYSIAASDTGSFIECLSGTFTLSFPDNTLMGPGWNIEIRNSGTGYITLAAANSRTINGLSTFVIGPSITTMLSFSGTELRILGNLSSLAAVIILSPDTASLTPISNGELLYSSTRTYNSASSVLSLANNVFFAGTLASTATQTSIASSTNGTTWSTRTLPPTSVSGYSHVAFGSGLYAALGSQTGTNAEIATATSPSGTWTARTASGFSSGFMRGLISNGTSFFGLSQTSSAHLYSADGITWTLQATPADVLYSGIYHTNAALMMAFPGNGTNYYTSPTGLTWTTRTAPASLGFQPGAPSYINGSVYIQQINSTNWYSTANGINWTLMGQGPSSSSSSLGKMNGTWICTSSNDGIYTSVNFIQWAKRNGIAGTFQVPSSVSNATLNLTTANDASGIMVSSLTVKGLFV